MAPKFVALALLVVLVVAVATFLLLRPDKWKRYKGIAVNGTMLSTTWVVAPIVCGTKAITTKGANAYTVRKRLPGNQANVCIIYGGGATTSASDDVLYSGVLEH